jgi:hypothetical protein
MFEGQPGIGGLGDGLEPTRGEYLVDVSEPTTSKVREKAVRRPGIGQVADSIDEAQGDDLIKKSEVIHQVGRTDHRRPPPTQVAELLHQVRLARRVQAGGRLVEEQQSRPSQ